MGVVYRARQLELDLPVALKVIRPEWAHDDDFRARFKREARLAASLHHPHVVSPHDFGDHEGQLFVVMPLIPGTDLGTVIERDGPLAPQRAADGDRAGRRGARRRARQRAGAPRRQAGQRAAGRRATTASTPT